MVNKVTTKKLLGILSLSYKKQPLPTDLAAEISTCYTSAQKKVKHQQILNTTKKTSFSLLGIFTLGVLLVNTVPAVANAAADVPGLGALVSLVTFQKHEVASPHQEVRIDRAQLKAKSSVANELNAKYLQAAQTEYQDFQQTIGEDPDAYISVNSGYEKVTDDQRFLVIKHWVTEIQASSSEKISYDTVDKTNDALLSLPLLFKNNDYIATISQEVKRQMAENIKSDPHLYWTEEDHPADTPPFSKIKEDQSFYINQQHQLVVVFGEHEIGPYSTGTTEFTIPTNLLTDLLVDGDYLTR